MAVATSLDAKLPAAGVPAYLRSRGSLALRFEQRFGATVLRRRQEGGCLRVRVPRVLSGEVPEAVVINTSGGLCGGDSIVQDVGWNAGSAAVVTTQAAEKVYGSQGPACAIATRLTVGQGARAEWLPQETILFDHARLRRETRIDLAEDAALLWCEMVVFGRLARGESFAQGLLHDRVRLWRAGRLVYADVLDLSAPAAQLQRAALGNGARASATILFADGNTALPLDALRARLASHTAVFCGASAWRGLISARLLSTDPAALRRCLADALGCLRAGAELPRVWRC